MLWFQFSDNSFSFLLDMQDQSRMDQLITDEANSWKPNCYGMKHILDPVGHCFLLVNVIMTELLFPVSLDSTQSPVFPIS
jgi:hypothetical protein